MADETPHLRSGLPATPPGEQPGEPVPQIGHDEWVARAGERIQTQRMRDQFGRVHWVVWFATAIAGSTAYVGQCWPNLSDETSAYEYAPKPKKAT